MDSATQIASWLKATLNGLLREPRRKYAAPWNDWPNGDTGTSKYPVIYALWSRKEDDFPQYIGRTTGLGRRLAQHFGWKGWRPTIQYVSYFESEKFESPEILYVAEAFAIAVLKPPQNAETWKKSDST